MDKMLVAAGLKAGFDACLFEKALANADIKGLVESASKVGGGGGGGGGGGAAAAPAAAAAAAPAAAKKAAPPPEEDEDMGFSLFD
jgi:ribosomal protein L12E/L44/L45/RPP1/RPP2